MLSKRSLLALLATVAISAASALNCKGCTPLDNITFDKMVKNFRVSLIKFDVAYPYGDKHDEFAKVATDGAPIQDLFIGEVGIKDYGEKDNEDLGKRFKVNKEDYPTVMLFVNKDGQTHEYRFSGEEFNSENLKNFVRQNSGIYLPLPGCLESLDLLADKVSVGEGKDSWPNVLKQMEAEVEKIEDEKVKKRANIYVKIMNKVISEGIEFVAKETERTKKLMDGKLTDLKKKDLQQKINILRAFTKQDKKKDEL